MTKTEIKEEVKKIDAQMRDLNAQMNEYWAKASKSNQDEILLRVKLKKLNKTQNVLTKVLLGLAGVSFATAIFVNPILLTGTVFSLILAFSVNGIYNNLIEQKEEKIKQYAKNSKENRGKQEELFEQIEELKSKRFELMSKLEELKSMERVEGEGKLKPIKKESNRNMKRGNNREK